MNIVIVGLGLIGGSMAKGLVGSGHKIFGMDLNKAIMRQCYDEGYVENHSYDEIILREADLIILCLYPKSTVSFLRQNQNAFKPGCIITDVAGLKAEMMTAINDFIRSDLYFIGGHPMAGRAGQGYEQSTKSIFKGANYLLIAGGPDHCYAILKELIRHLGCGHIEILDAKEHDELIAYTSHMPHLLAAALVYNHEHSKSRHCIAGSFNDITRVADFNGGLWSELFISNKQALLKSIKDFQETLDQMSYLIQEDDEDQMAAFLGRVREKKMHLS